LHSQASAPPLQPQNSPPGITGKNLSRSFVASDTRDLLALDDVSLTVQPGEFVAIIGPSGCGKTTLLKILGGLLEPDNGSVLIGDSTTQSARRRKSIGYVFQEPALLPWSTVQENIRLPLEVNTKSHESDGDTSGVEKAMTAVGLEEFAAYYPHQLSGGMKQRVALARTFAFNSTLLLMDEPFGSLDEITREAMRYELLGLWEATGKTVVFVTHSVPEAIVLADRVVVMSGRPGRVVAEITIDLPRPRDEQLERSTRFLELTSQVRRALSAGARAAGANPGTGALGR
jgi:NitT/TauT family transport system ATP-binding protein